MILTEKRGEPWFYKISNKVQYINFDINFDDLDYMPILKKIWYYNKKQRKYKKLFTQYLNDIRPDITVSACRREINFISDIKDGSKKFGEIHFSKQNHRKIDIKILPRFINVFISNIWMYQFVRHIKKLDKFIVLSYEDKKNWKGLNNIEVIHNPVKNIPLIYSDCTNKKAIAVGRYTYVKGFDLLIDSWYLVNKKHPDWILNIYGSGNDEQYQKIANQKGLKDNIICHKATQDIYNKYIESSIFLFSSRNEGFGLVLAEAMSCGIPAVSFDCPCGPKDIITNNVDGYLIQPQDTTEFANKICFLIENENKRKVMGDKAKQIILKFREDVIMEKWINLFNNVIDQNGKR